MRINIVNRIYRWRLKNNEISLLANNCNGAFILHDLGLPFNSPFVNLWLSPQDFIKYVRNIKYYMGCSLKFEQNSDYPYPVAMLDDICIFFQHYSTEEEAKRKWEERTQRINLNHIYVLLTERDGCTQEIMECFCKLPYKHKALLTHLPHPELSCAHYIKGFENESQCGILSLYIPNQYRGKRYYDRFDFVKWLNE